MREVSEDSVAAEVAEMADAAGGGGGGGSSVVHGGSTASTSDPNPHPDGGNNSDYSGYHSDHSDSTVMMSGNSPFISKSARYNFLQRSGQFRRIQYGIYVYVGICILEQNVRGSECVVAKSPFLMACRKSIFVFRIEGWRLRRIFTTYINLLP